MNKSSLREKATASQEMQDPVGEDTIQRPRVGNPVVDTTELPSQRGSTRALSTTVSSLSEYFVAHVTDTLEFDSVSLFHSSGSFECHSCQLGTRKRRLAIHQIVGVGFLSDQLDSPDPQIRYVADLFATFFRVVCDRGLESWLKQVHHFNVALYYCSEPSDHLLHALASSLRAHTLYVTNNIHTRHFHDTVVGGAKGKGLKPEKKNEEPEPEYKDVKYKRNSKRNQRKGHKSQKPSPRPQTPVTVSAQPSVTLPDSFSDLGESEYTFGTAEEFERDYKKSSPPNKQPRNGTRCNKRANLTTAAVADLAAQVDGVKDSQRDREQADKELKAEVDKEQKELTKQLTVAAYVRGASTGVNFKSRPAMNYGFRYKGMSSFGNDISRPWFYGTAGFCITSLLCPFFTPLALKLFALQFESCSFKLYHSVNSIEHSDVSLRDARDELVDARPSETKIGDSELNQIASTAEMKFPAKIVAVPDENLESNDAVTKVLVHDDSILKRAVARMSTISTHIQRVYQGFLYFVGQGNDVVTSVVSSIDAYVATLEAPIEDENPMALGSRDRTAMTEEELVANIDHNTWFAGPNAFVAKAADGHTFVNGQGSVVPLYCFMMLGAKALLDDRSPVYLSSSNAKEVEKPFNQRLIEGFVYDYETENIDYCAHSYHNASTYGAMSSQISPDVNFSMIYRKLSRYTSINQNRFGRKDLLCNAEQIARLQYWAIREGNLAKSSRLHF